jgi:hypothetical protein
MERNRKEFYTITQEESFSGDMEFDTEKQALEHLKAILHEESNYNYWANKNNTYILYQAIYNENTEDYDYYEILPKISIKEYRDMTWEEKDLYFSEGKKNE